MSTKHTAKRVKPPAWRAAEHFDKLLGALGVSNTVLADRIGLKDAAISRYRSGERAPNPDRLTDICRATGLSADEILGLSVSDASALHELARLRRALGSVATAVREVEGERERGRR